MNKITERYNRTKTIFDKHHDQILKDMDKSKYKKSIKAIYRQQDKISKLTEGLIAISNTVDNFYPIQAISRIIIEHFIVGHYIWTKARLTKNDEIGEQYYMHYDISEFFKRENYELRIEGIRLNRKNHNTFDNIIKKHPEFKDMEEGQLTEIHKTAKQFDVRDIFEYFINGIPKDIFSDFHKLMLSALSEYNHLSSYVHGGPTAELETYEGRQNTNREERIKDCIDFAKVYSRTMKEHVMLLLLEEMPEYIDVLRPLFPELKE